MSRGALGFLASVLFVALMLGIPAVVLALALRGGR